MPGPRALTQENRERATIPATAPATVRRRVTCALACALAALTSAPTGWAQANRDVQVTLLRPVPCSELLSEAILRIKSELLAGGFRVAVTDSPAEGLLPDPRLLNRWAGKRETPSATLAIFGDLAQGSAELWVVDRLTDKAVIRRVQVETSSDRPISEVLAIRAQELLRASLVEVFVEDATDQPPAPTPPKPEAAVLASPVAPSPAPWPWPAWRFAVELGASALGGTGGLGPTVCPAARARVAVIDGLWLRLTGLGLGSQPVVQAAKTGSAAVAQTVLLLETVAWLRAPGWVRPMLSLGAGAERFAVTGSAGLPFRGEENARWFFAADAGLGFAVRLGWHWEAQVEAHALLAAPRPTVRFFDREVAQAGQPIWLAVVTLAGGA